MAVDIGVNFRETSGYVTDGAGQTYCLNENYPTTRATFTFGFTDGLGGDRVRNRDSALDPRLAGGHFTNSSGAQDRVLVWQFDLPNTGTYKFRIAAGDPFNTRLNQKVEIFDNTSSLGVLVNDASTAAGAFMDATNVERANAATWVSNNALSSDLVFTSTTLVVKIGTSSAGTNQTFWNHIQIIEQVTAVKPKTLATLGVG